VKEKHEESKMSKVISYLTHLIQSEDDVVRYFRVEYTRDYNNMVRHGSKVDRRAVNDFLSVN
jgi:hypothetical protein